MQTSATSGAPKSVTQKRHSAAKPFTQTEQRSRDNGLRWLHLARLYVRLGDRTNAVSCCLEGLWLILGVSRPLVVRDQLQDLLDAIDPAGEIADQIRNYINPSAKPLVGIRHDCPPNMVPGSVHQKRQLQKQCETTPVIFVPRAVPCNDAHEPVVLLTHRDRGSKEGFLVFEDSDQLHQFVYELVQIHRQWTTHCAFVADPQCVCRQTSKT
jgi:hypothetical protein